MSNQRVMLFWACFAALVATSFGFIIRALLIDTWGTTYNFTGVQKGEIFGAGLWPFAISIILFSLVIDKIGYGTAMVFAFICHVLSALITIFGPGMMDPYWALWIGAFVVALANGTVEAVINPVVATMFPTEKVKWLSILHAGWPGGLVLGGLLTMGLANTDWRVRVALIFLPTIFYGIFMLGKQFPVQERVSAGVSYRDMLREFGFIGAFLCSFLVITEITRVFAAGSAELNPQLPYISGLIGGAVIAVIFGAVTGFAPGQPLFLFLMLVMIPLATTELGVDTWVSSLMAPVMGDNAGIVLVYTSFIMMVLRFAAGGIVHRLSPIGLLAISAALAMVGLFVLSTAAGFTILVAATLYALGKTFFWPATLGTVSEQFPRGGALTINAIAGLGMLAVGIFGTPFIGLIQDKNESATIASKDAAVYQQVKFDKKWAFGAYEAVNPEEVKKLPDEAKRKEVEAASAAAKQAALKTVCLFPAIMLVSYILLLGYFKSKGGYQAEVLTGHAAHDEDFTGGKEGPVEA